MDKRVMGTRKDFIFKKYCANPALTPDQFIERVKTAYYKYDAPHYNPQYEYTLLEKFSLVFADLKDKERDVIDIGAGTGQGLKLVKVTNYKYHKYYFLEPFKSMSDQCDQIDDSVVVINGYIEDLQDEHTEESVRPRIFIICAVLRTISSMPSFLSSLDRLLRPGDVVFFPIEPNNSYFETGHFWMIPYKVKYKLGALLKSLKYRIVGWGNTSSNRYIESLGNKSPLNGEDVLTSTLNELKKDGVVNESFSKNTIMAIVYYNNYLYWTREIRSIPQEWNEGFFQMQNIADTINCNMEITCSDYFYGIEYFRLAKLQKLIDSFLNIIVPGRGATLSVVMTRKWVSEPRLIIVK
jgi:hypothetical protein